MDFMPSRQTLYYVGWRSFHHKGYLVAYARSSDEIGLTKYQTFSEADTDDLFKADTWDTVNWVWRGSSCAFYELAREHTDPSMTSRKIEKSDKDAKWLLKLLDVFVEWYEAGKPCWENLTEKREFSSICGDFGDTGLAAVSSFDRDTAMRDQDRAEAAQRIAELDGKKISLVPLTQANFGDLPEWLQGAMQDVNHPE